MKSSIDVSSRKEADAIKSGLEDPEVRAFVVVLGTLKELEPRARQRVLQNVIDRFSDDVNETAVEE